MTRFAGFNWSPEDGHPPEKELYLLVDGELSEANATTIEKHLEACWQCRVRVEKIQTTISAFVDYRNQVQMPIANKPPRNWQGFGQRLSELQHESTATLERLQQMLTRVRTIEVPRPLILTTVSLIMVGGLVAILSWRDRTATVSAKEVLQNATTAYAKQLQKSSEPVTYQQFSLRSQQQSAQWEVWHDTQRSRWRHSLDETRETRKQTAPNVWREMEEIHRVNQLNWQQPLSAAAYQMWRQTIAVVSEAVTASKQNGQDVWMLKTTVNPATANGAITESNFIVRQRDCHPIAHSMRVKTDNGEREYEISETKFEVVSLNVIGAHFFADAPLAKAVIAPSPTPSASLSPSSSPMPSPPLLPSPTASTAPAITLAELQRIEVEALRLLHQAGADLGEQIEVKRNTNRVVISGIVEDQTRQTQLKKQLAALTNNSAVQIEIKTVAEAVAQDQSANNSSTAVRMQFEGERAEPPAFPTLRQYFEKQTKGTDVDAQVNRTARQILTQSREGMQRAYALRQLRTRLLTANELPVEARTQLLTITQSHARQLIANLRALEQSLQPHFPVNISDNATSIVEGEFAHAIDQLFAAMSETDRAVRSSFASSSASSSALAVTSTEFRRAMQQARNIALGLLNYKIS
jgi:hypothetical protein